ncbi:hypothetical protein D1006_07750 [Burkholderia stabilis]|uniref:Uncharacterized protein n=1 Tax=Burkholderia stabilis TaxID=95485 RepID=A0A4Q2AWM4_9BURK|nr:hypothetical protein D1006_07750 [Burkholderia stabilis]
MCIQSHLRRLLLKRRHRNRRSYSMKFRE